MQVIIIAGCVGFIGSNFITYFLKEKYRIQLCKYRCTQVCYRSF